MNKSNKLAGIMRKTFEDMCKTSDNFTLRLFEDVLLNEKNKRVKKTNFAK